MRDGDDDECDVGMQMYAGGHLRFFCQRWNQLPFQAFLPRDDDHDVWMEIGSDNNSFFILMLI